MTRFVAVSDTHCQLNRVHLPEGDVLIHAGDLTYRGTISEIARELHTLKQMAQNFKHIIFIAGNHDWLFEQNPLMARQLCNENGITYLHDELFTIPETGQTIYGSPWQPEFGQWAFNLPRKGKKLKAVWDLIPSCDILVTHSPPHGYGDKLDDLGSFPGEHVGCEELLKAVNRVKPKVHVCGHIHEGSGIYQHENTKIINASICDSMYRPRNHPVQFEI